jgi:hypothetical protein
MFAMTSCLFAHAASVSEKLVQFLIQLNIPVQRTNEHKLICFKLEELLSESFLISETASVYAANVRGFHTSKNSSGSIEMNIFSTINEDVLLQ